MNCKLNSPFFVPVKIGLSIFVYNICVPFAPLGNSTMAKGSIMTKYCLLGVSCFLVPHYIHYAVIMQ